MSETGPIYGVELIDSLPLNGNGMRQACPSRSDLDRVRKISERTAAGYEAVLAHYREAVKEIERLQRDLDAAQAENKVLRDECNTLSRNTCPASIEIEERITYYVADPA